MMPASRNKPGLVIHKGFDYVDPAAETAKLELKGTKSAVGNRREIGRGTRWKTFMHLRDNRKVLKQTRDSGRRTFRKTQRIYEMIEDSGYGDILPKRYKIFRDDMGVVINYEEEKLLKPKLYTEAFGKIPDTSRIERAVEELRRTQGIDLEFKQDNWGGSSTHRRGHSL